MAANLQHPFQCLQFVERPNANFLIGSAGSKLYSYSAETGQQLAIWPQAVESSNGAEAQLEQGPPEKKRKVEDTQTAEPSGPTSETPEKSQASPAWSNIPILTTTANGEYVVALTAEDKCIRVFQFQEDGSFTQLSERTMPKRPSAITITSDDNTILCGDKFGDVYSLPLIPGDKPHVATRVPRGAKLSQPAATNLTVHTKGNLKALEQQQKLSNEAKAEEKPGLAFEHNLLLGHVSLLTDIAYVSLPDASSTKKRNYILTADRDEHIRVSRGLTQAHIVENYCLGHTSFISQLCVPQWAPEYLVSGGGDKHLLVWKWAEGRILQKVPLVDQASETAEVAVHGIWATSLGGQRAILVALHGSPRLQCFTLEADGTLTSQAPIQLSGNALGLTSIEKDNTILVSVDCIREPGTTHEWRASPSSPSALIEAFRVKSDTGLEWEQTAASVLEKIHSTGTSEVPLTTTEKERKELNDSLYNLGHLRKKKGEDE